MNNSENTLLDAALQQLVVSWVMYEDVRQVDKIEGGERGASGFGSTGR